jgi:hypothetical protein
MADHRAFNFGDQKAGFEVKPTPERPIDNAFEQHVVPGQRPLDNRPPLSI